MTFDGKSKKCLWPSPEKYINVHHKFKYVNDTKYLANCVDIALISANLFTQEEVKTMYGVNGQLDFQKLKMNVESAVV